MIGIEVKGQFLDLPKSISIRLRKKNIIFGGYNVTKVYGSFTFPITIPLTTKNKILLDFPDRPDQYGRIRQMDAKLSYNGMPVSDGLMTIEKSTRHTASLKISVGNMSGLKGVSLKELNLGSYSEPSAPVMVDHAKHTAQYPDQYNYIFFPVLNKQYFADTDPENDTVQWKGIKHNEWENGNFKLSEDANIVTPFLKYDFIIKKIFEKIGYTAENQWMDDELRNLVMYNVGNLYNKDVESWGTTIDLVDFVPDHKVSDVLKGLIGVFDLGIYPDFARKNVKIVSIKEIRKSPPKSDWTIYALPDWTKKDYIGDVSSIGYDIDESDLLSEEFPYVGDVPDCDDNTPPFEKCYDYAYNDIRFKLQTGPWIPIQKVFKRQVFGPGKPKLHKLIPLYMNPTSTMPRAKIGRKEKPGMRMMIYRGMINGIPTSNNHIFDGSTLRDDWKYSLLWNGEKGIYNTWHGDATNRVEIKRQFLLPIREFINLEFQNKVVVDNMEYIVSEIDVILSNEGGMKLLCSATLISS